MSVTTSTRTDGDMHPHRTAPSDLGRRRRALVDLPWTMLDQIHGVGTVTVDHPGAGDGATGDVVVLDCDDAAVGVWAADCAPVAVIAPDGVVALVHAGWRGLAAGVLAAACDAVGVGVGGRRPGVAVLGPCIRACCNEFGRSDLDAVAAGCGLRAEQVTATTSWGSPALDVPAAVRAALQERTVMLVDEASCTGCDQRWFSHRRRHDLGRHVTAVWREAIT